MPQHPQPGEHLHQRAEFHLHLPQQHARQRGRPVRQPDRGQVLGDYQCVLQQGERRQVRAPRRAGGPRARHQGRAGRDEERGRELRLSAGFPTDPLPGRRHRVWHGEAPHLQDQGGVS